MYWVDPGVLRATKRQLGALSAEERGPLFESWVLTTLRAHAETRRLYEQIGYWSPHQTQAEVDFVLRRGRELLAIEVKAASRYHTGLPAGLRAFGQRADLARRLLVYTGPRSYRSEDGIDVWPAQRFGSAVAAGEIWP